MPKVFDFYQDALGEPTPLALQLIKEADVVRRDPKDLMKFVKKLWRGTGWEEYTSSDPQGENGGTTYKLNTYGMTQNQEIVQALRDNKTFWDAFWAISKFNGYHQFFIPNNRKQVQEPTCGHCGKKMRHNCPRIGDEGGFVHDDTGEFYCEGLNKHKNTQIEDAVYGGPPQTVKSYQEALSEGMAEVIKSQDEKKDWKAAHDMQQKLVVALELEKIELKKKINKLQTENLNYSLSIKDFQEAGKQQKEKIIELQEWKFSAMQIEQSLKAQEIGKELRLPLGTAIHPKILPAIQDLKNTINNIWVELNGGVGFTVHTAWDFLEICNLKNLAPRVKCLVDRCYNLKKENVTLQSRLNNINQNLKKLTEEQ